MDESMAKRWSKLQKRLYNLRDKNIDFQIHCAVYEMNSNDGHHGNKLPRYFITVQKKIIFDYPKEFDTNHFFDSTTYPWLTDMGDISDVIEEYIQCPESEFLRDFVNDKWGITDIFKVCDRRIGKRRLQELEKTITNEKLIPIIEMRTHEKT